MTELRFLSPSLCPSETVTSPLRRALDTVSDTVVRKLDGSGDESVSRRPVEDLSLQGVVEVRGDVALVEPSEGEELVWLSPRRGFLFTDADPFEVARRLRETGVHAYDATGAFAGLALQGKQVMRRLTDLDLDKLPAAGPFARVSALVLRDEGDRFRVYVPQELGHDVALAVLDALDGLGSAGTPHTEVRLKPDPSGAV